MTNKTCPQCGSTAFRKTTANLPGSHVAVVVQQECLTCGHLMDSNVPLGTLVQSMQPCPPDFQKVLDDNFWDLVETNAPVTETTTTEHLYSLNELLGHFAMWAVRQSPYAAPVNLTEALTKLHELLQPFFTPSEEFFFLRTTKHNLGELLFKAFASVPEIEAWNEPKSQHTTKVITRSRIEGVAPDDDFIDLHALARNTLRSLTEEVVNFEGFCKRHESGIRVDEKELS